VKSFLQHIVDDLDDQNALSLKDQCFVFPSRRACVYFNDLVQKKYYNSTYWAPTVLSIEEFVQLHTPELTVVDEIRLLFKLYEVYKKEEPAMVFDKFYAWGQTLIKDFDEIDRYLVDADLLYKNLQEVENIEETFGPDEEIIKAIKGFQEVIDISEGGKLVKEFSNTWQLVGKVYNSFKSSLKKEGWAYNGLCYRELSEKLKDGIVDLPYSQIIFSGFNALSKAETQIIDSLLAQDKAKIYFDTDSFYFDNEKEEAGYFLRKMKRHWRNNANVKWIVTNGFEQQKSIDIVGVSQKTAQARAAAGKLQQSDSSAIVLADESLLMPVLYALPELDESLNITMGYPILGTTTANLILAYFKYQVSIITGANNKRFVKIDEFRELMDQAAIKSLLPKEILKLGQSRSRFMSTTLIAEKLLLANENSQDILNKLFTPITDTGMAVSSISETILSLYLLKRDTLNADEILEERVIYTLVSYLQDLNGIIAGTDLKISLAILEKIVKGSFSKMTAPFAGEPLANRQIMGFLETRALDFDNLVLLSVNEDLLPAPGNANTYIPFAIRKAFQLPTFLEHNSIYAYHFFRLLQRAKNITLIYNTQLSVVGSGEKSRFILQLLNRFANEKSAVVINHYRLLPQLSTNTGGSNQITYKKTGIVLQQLQAHFNSFSEDRPLTPTALVDYLTCSLKYYFSRILRIREPEESSSEIDARVFGNLLHDILEKVYEPWVGKEISQSDLHNLIKNKLSAIVDTVFNEYDHNSTEIAFTRHVILYLCRKIIQNDLDDAPLKILDLESRNNPLLYKIGLADGRSLPLGGKIDRLDQIILKGQAITRVLDYKTGKAELKGRTYNRKEISNEDYIEAHFSDPKFKSGFQLYFYCLLNKRSYSEQAINGGIIGVKKLGKGVDYLRGVAEPLDNDLIDLFEQNLKRILNELFDEDSPFEQTEDIDRCKYCDFKSICSR